MRPFIFSPPQLAPADFGEDAALAWESGSPNDAAIADVTMSAWEKLLHAHAALCGFGDAMVAASVAAREAAESVAEAAVELRFQAHVLGEVEYSDEIAADTLREALSRIFRATPPDSLEPLFERLCERERMYRSAREELDLAAASYRECWRRFAVEARRYRRRRGALRQAVRHVVRLARAA